MPTKRILEAGRKVFASYIPSCPILSNTSSFKSGLAWYSLSRIQQKYPSHHCVLSQESNTTAIRKPASPLKENTSPMLAGGKGFSLGGSFRFLGLFLGVSRERRNLSRFFFQSRKKWSSASSSSRNSRFLPFWMISFTVAMIVSERAPHIHWHFANAKYTS